MELTYFISDDTLAGIGVKFSVSVELIKRLNKMYLAEIDIRPGQVLKLPRNNNLQIKAQKSQKCKKGENNNIDESEPKSVMDFLKSIDSGIMNSKSKIEKFDSSVIQRLENTFNSDSVDIL